MAIALDTSAQSNSYSFSYTCSGSNRALIVGIFNGGGAGNVTGVTYNGVAMTKINAKDNDGYELTLWRLLNPDSGANTLTINKTTTSSNLVLVESYTGVGGIDSSNSGQTARGYTSLNVVDSVIAQNCWIVCLGSHICYDYSIDINFNYTARQNNQLDGNNIQAKIGDSNGTVSTGSITTAFSSGTTRPSSMVNGLVCALYPYIAPLTNANFLQLL